MSDAVPIDYDAQTVGAANPLARFSHRARLGRAASLAAEYLARDAVLVDFGAGPGDFLASMSAARPDVQCIAIEPHMPPREGGARYIKALAELEPQSVDVLTALEVCEHLDDMALRAFVHDARRVLSPSGRLIVSVPIMVGLAAPTKEFNRVVFNRFAPENSLGELLSATFGKPPVRPDGEARQVTHKGFDFRDCRRVIEQRFRVQYVQFSPLAKLPWFVNSQAFFVCRTK